MRQLKLITIIIIFLSATLVCVSKSEMINSISISQGNKKVLIVYLTRTKNTKAIAEIIHQKVGGRLTEIETDNPYPEDYKTMVDQVEKENQTNYLPPLKNKIDNIGIYDVVFIGFPTWGMKLPPPIKSFLNEYDLSGKTVVPFNTNAGYGVGDSFDTLKQMAGKSTVLEGFSTTGGIERDGIFFVMKGERRVKAEKEVIEWLKKLGLTN